MANVKIYKRITLIFALDLAVSEILNFKLCDLQKVGQAQVVQFSQCHHSMTNAKIYKCLQTKLCKLLQFQRYKKNKFCFYLEKVGHGHEVQFSQ